MIKSKERELKSTTRISESTGDMSILAKQMFGRDLCLWINGMSAMLEPAFSACYDIDPGRLRGAVYILADRWAGRNKSVCPGPPADLWAQSGLRGFVCRRASM
ncbi:unnamed protein product [Menidia menidia]|uniref:(Atlantic silverside) hypothetical protein n=1 Tax=Menidia menidia TaxID=238744 RepID=A0A8S4AI03_9TELE|nr:unnamed protein product [Menidia menidia]